MTRRVTPNGIMAAFNMLDDNVSAALSKREFEDAINVALDYSYDTDDIVQVKSPRDLKDFLVEHDLRGDWINAEESNITATVIGKVGDFDNVSAYVDDVYDHDGEMAIVLWKTSEDKVDPATGTFKLEQPLAVINLALLFTFATGFNPDK